jgi:hypothetical protein
MSKILMGSTYFFSCYPDFKSKDIDEIEIIETNEFKQMRQITGCGKCLFQLKKHETVQEYIDWALECQLGMVVGKFLVPEFNAAIGLSMADLKQLSPLIERLDDKHQYEAIIYNAYIENNSFTLTDEQRLEAYMEYKNSRSIKE